MEDRQSSKGGNKRNGASTRRNGASTRHKSSDGERSIAPDPLPPSAAQTSEKKGMETHPGQAVPREDDASRGEAEEVEMASPVSKRAVMFVLRREVWNYFEDYIVSLQEACKMVGRPTRLLWWELNDGSDWGEVSKAVRVKGGPHCIFVQRMPPGVDRWPSEVEGVRGSGLLALMNTEQCTREWVINYAVSHATKGVTVVDYSQTNVDMLHERIRIAHPPNGKDRPVRALCIPYQLARGRPYREHDIPPRVHQAEANGESGRAEVTPPHSLCGREMDAVQVNVDTERRGSVQRGMKGVGLKVADVRGWREERESQIDRAKVLVNVHYESDCGVFEHLRCDQVIYRKGAVIVSEDSVGQDLLDIKDRVLFVPYSGVVDKVKEVAGDIDSYYDRCYKGWDPEEWARCRLSKMEEAFEQMDQWASQS